MTDKSKVQELVDAYIPTHLLDYDVLMELAHEAYSLGYDDGAKDGASFTVKLLGDADA